VKDLGESKRLADIILIGQGRVEEGVLCVDDGNGEDKK
jgi:hypothetical protein